MIAARTSLVLFLLVSLPLLFTPLPAPAAETTLPTPTISAPSATATKNGPVSFTIAYANAISIDEQRFQQITINTTGTAYADPSLITISGTGTASRTVSINSITGEGTIGISIPAGTAFDAAGNAFSAAGPSATFRVDSTPPTISVSAPSVTATKSGPVTYTVTYTDLNFASSTLAPPDITLVATGDATGTVTVSGTTGNTRTVTIGSITGNGTLGISIGEGTATDLAGNPAPASGSSTTFSVDSAVPTISIGAPSATSTRTGPITYSVTYADSNFNSSAALTAAKVTLVKTGTATGTVAISSGTGTSRTVTINSISGTGTLGISIAAGTASDTLGNLAPASGNSATFSVDSESPSITISAPSATSTRNGPITYTVTYADANFDSSTLALANITLNRTGTANGTLSVDNGTGTSRTVTIDSIIGEGTLGISIAAGTAVDTYGNLAKAAGPSATFSVDITPPAIAISAPSAASTRIGPITYTVTYTDAHFNASTLSVADITLNATGTATGTIAVSGTGTTRTVKISSISGEGTLGISIAAGTATDLAGNLALAPDAASAFVVDSTAPTITISDPSAASTTTANVSYTVTYYDPRYNSSTLSAAKITLNKTGTATGTVSVSGTGAVRTVTIGSISGDGTLGISVAAGTATDTLGNLAPAAGPSTTFIVDSLPPTVAISPPSATSASSGPITYTVTYADTRFDSSTLTTGDITLNSTGDAAGTLSVSGTGNIRTVTIGSITGNGTLGISIAAGTATDLYGNSSAAAGPSATFIVDNTSPLVASISAPSATSTKAGPVTYTVTYADAHFNASTLSPTDITLNTTGSATGTVAVSGTGNTRTVKISSITGNGTVGISIAAGTASDLAGNLATAAGPSATFTVDNTPPTIGIGPPSATSTRSAAVTYTVTYTDANFNSSAALTAAKVTLVKTGTATGSVTLDSTTGATRTVTIGSIGGTGTLGITIAAGTASDSAGNTAPTASSQTFIVDNAPPTISIGAPSAANTRIGPITYEVTYGDPNLVSSTLAAGDITLNATGTANGTVSVDSGTGATRTVTIGSITGDGTLGISIAGGTAGDITLNTASAAGPSTTFTADNTPPTISIGPPSATSTKTGPISYTVTYADARFSAATLSPADITLVSTGDATGTIAVTGTGTTRTVKISSITGTGTLGISIAAGTAGDQAGNLAPAAGPSATFAVDGVVPTVIIGDPSATITRGGPVTYTVTYTDENFKTSAALTPAKVTLAKTGTATGTVSVDSLTGNTRTITIGSITGNGTLGISIAAGSATDVAGNLAPASGPSATFVVDNTSPMIISISSPTVATTRSGPVSYTVTYSDLNFASSSLSAADVTLNKTGTATGTVSVDSGTGDIRTVTISNISGNGTLGISIAKETASDLVGILAPASGQSGLFAVDNTLPSAAITLPADNTNVAGTAVIVKGTASDAVSFIQRVEISTDNGSTWRTANGTTSWSYNWTIPLDGSYRILARAVDAAGNIQSSAAAITLNVGNTPPDTILTSAPSDPSQDSAGVFTFISTKAGATFECKVDSIAYAPCASPFTNSALADGRHSLAVRAKDSSGVYDPTPAVHAWSVSNASRIAVLSGVPPSPTTSDSALITVSGTGIATYQFQLDSGAWSPEIPVATPISFSGLANGPHVLLVKGKDELSGSWQPYPTTVAWTVDTVLPETTIVYSPATLSATASGIFSFTSSKPGTSFQCSLDGGEYAPCVSPFLFSALANGIHTFAVRGTDPAGNIEAAPAAYTWTVDTITHIAVLTDAPPVLTKETSATTLISNSDVIVAYKYKLDDGEYTEDIESSVAINLVGLADGPHTLYVVGKDAAGAYQPSPTSVGWMVDTVAPVTTIISRPAEVSGVITGNIHFTASKPGSTLLCKLDAGSFTPCSSPYGYAGLSDGPHTFAVTATDPAGNVQVTPTTATWTVDTTVPTASITYTPAGPFKAGDLVTMTAAFSKPMAIYPDPRIAFSGAYSMASTPMTRVDATHYVYTYTVGIASGIVNVSLTAGFDTIGNAVAATPVSGATFSVIKTPQTVSFEPLPAAEIDDKPFTLFATASSGLPVTFDSSNPAIAAVSGNSITIMGVGTATITASQAGNEIYAPASATQKLVVTYSSDLPTLTISTLADGAVTNVATLNISGTVISPNGIKSLSINGAGTAIDSNQGFSRALTLKQGTNVITTIATDKAGKQTKDTRNITMDITPPAVTISSPADNSVLSASFVTVTGTLDDKTATVQATVNGGTPQSATTSGGSFSVTLNLAAGLNTIAVTSTDLVGNNRMLKRTVTSDTTKPNLAVTDPGQDVTVNKTSMTLSGTVSDALTAVTVTVAMDGKTYIPKIAADGSFQQQLTFAKTKQYQITVTSADLAGNSVTTVRNVIYVLPGTGDMNSDGDVDIADALMGLKMAVDVIPPTPFDVLAGDVAPMVNGKPAPDGKIDITDALLILEKAVGLVKW